MLKIVTRLLHHDGWNEEWKNGSKSWWIDVLKNNEVNLYSHTWHLDPEKNILSNGNLQSNDQQLDKRNIRFKFCLYVCCQYWWLLTIWLYLKNQKYQLMKTREWKWADQWIEQHYLLTHKYAHLEFIKLSFIWVYYYHKEMNC